MNLLFDLDGTLTDPSPGITDCMAYALREAGTEPPSREVLESFIGPPLLDTFGRLLGSAEAADRALACYRDRYREGGMLECRVHDGIPGCLASLACRYQLFVVTSKPTAFAEPIVSHFGLSSYFDAVFGSELDGSRVDKGELIAHVSIREGLVAGDTIMIGDRRHDIEGARTNDMRSIGVLWGFGSRHELETAGADALCDRPVALPSLLESVLAR